MEKIYLDAIGETLIHDIIMELEYQNFSYVYDAKEKSIEILDEDQYSNIKNCICRMVFGD